MTGDSTAIERERPGDARSRLQWAAIELFNRKGYAATSVREIAEAAGVTKPALYYHFGSKEGLFQALMGRARDELVACIEAPQDEAGSVRERVHLLAQRVLGLLRRRLEVVRLLHAARHGPRDETPPFDLDAVTRPLTVAFERLIDEGIRSGELRPTPVPDAVRAIEGTLDACLDVELAQLEPLPGPEGLARTLDVVFQGLEGGKEQSS